MDSCGLLYLAVEFEHVVSLIRVDVIRRIILRSVSGDFDPINLSHGFSSKRALDCAVSIAFSPLPAYSAALLIHLALPMESV